MSEILKIEDLDLNKIYSYADYLSFKFNERIEILKGFIYKMSPAPSRKHQKFLRNITELFFISFKNKPCEIYFAPFDVRLPHKKSDSNKEIFNVFQPDLCVICDLSKLDDKGCSGAPDLIVEVLSPGNSDKEMKIKFEIYESAGVREYWIVQPEYENVLIYVLESDKFIGKYPYNDKNLINSFIFPELQINLGSIFKD